MTNDSHAIPPASAQVLAQRRAGVLLHPTSLPEEGGSGAFGRHAYRFVDFLAGAGMSLWQMLPLGPTHSDLSPYQCLSVFAGNPLLIDLLGLVEEGWLAQAQPTLPGEAPGLRIQRALSDGLAGFAERASEEQREAFESFRRDQAFWLDDYCLYQALRDEHGRVSWLDWPAPLRDRDAEALHEARVRLATPIERVAFEQFVFDRQWRALKRYANDRGVLLFGDMPIFVAHDSAEVWGRREYFTLDDHGHAVTVAGVPPDYFSATGQYWGNPHYRWERMREDGFYWWQRRIEHQLSLFDVLRIDHFRGFEAYWEIPADAPNAIGGHWVKAPGDALFDTLQRELGPLPLVAEDLGLITPEVDALRHRYGLPGMKVLQFAFEGGAANPYLPHNHAPDFVVYTGTHDNNTTVGWFESASAELRAHVQEYLGSPSEAMPWPLIRAAYASVAGIAVVPMQDVLGLNGEHRMNTPGVTEDNWRWSFSWDQVPAGLTQRLRGLAELYGRLPDQQA
jgi:4-alpha-glucanotransferase